MKNNETKLSVLESIERLYPSVKHKSASPINRYSNQKKSSCNNNTTNNIIKTAFVASIISSSFDDSSSSGGFE